MSCCEVCGEVIKDGGIRLNQFHLVCSKACEKENKRIDGVLAEIEKTKAEQVFFKCSFCTKMLEGHPPHKVDYWNRISTDEWEWSTYWLACKECLPKLRGVFAQ